MIPFVDLKAQYDSIKDQIDTSIKRVIDNTSFIGGKEVELFEEEFAAFLGVKHCITCGNGTDALEILLKALDIGYGDEVIVPAISWISTSEAVSSVGAKAVFVDVNEYKYTIDEDKIEESITRFTKAIIPVHLYGQMCEMDTILKIAKKYKLKIIEDCAQAHGAEYKGMKAGTFGNGAAYSFFPGKNLGAYGDAGAMICNDADLADKCRMLSRHGQLDQKHVHFIEGRNSRMDTIQAAILRVKLPYLNQWTVSRQHVAIWYDDYLDNSKVIIPTIRENSTHVFHLYVIRVQNRSEVQKALDESKISYAVHYPTPLPFLTCYKNRGHVADDFPVSSKVKDEILSLPIYPELKRAEVKKISKLINEV